MKHLILLMACIVCAATAAAQTRDEFAWHGTVQTAPGTSVARIALPAEALARLQSPSAADVRVFDAQGRELPFAFAAPPEQAKAPRTLSAPFDAFALSGALPSRSARDAVEVRIEQGGEQRSVWVQAAPAADAGARVASVLFDTRKSPLEIDGLVLDASVPPDASVAFRLSWSEDLATWTPVAVRGRIYRFSGDGAPANDRLDLAQPLKLQGRWLRLDWSAQETVTVRSMRGLLVAAAREPVQVGIALPKGHAVGDKALDWALPFAWPVAALELVPRDPQALVPVRVLGRSRASEAWRVLGQGVVYRIESRDGTSTGAPLKLARASVRQLRVESTYAGRLTDIPLDARALFDPIEVVFLPSGAEPYEIAAGRAGTKPAALPLASIAAATKVKLEDIPAARIVASQAAPSKEAPAWLRTVAPGVDAKTAALWSVLLAGVAALAMVAWTLVRQLRGQGRSEGA